MTSNSEATTQVDAAQAVTPEEPKVTTLVLDYHVDTHTIGVRPDEDEGTELMVHFIHYKGDSHQMDVTLKPTSSVMLSTFAKDVECRTFKDEDGGLYKFTQPNIYEVEIEVAAYVLCTSSASIRVAATSSDEAYDKADSMAQDPYELHRKADYGGNAWEIYDDSFDATDTREYEVQDITVSREDY